MVNDCSFIERYGDNRIVLLWPGLYHFRPLVKHFAYFC